MKQIILNYLCLIVFPLIFGVIIRFSCRRMKRAYFVTIGLIVLSVIAWIAAEVIPSHGNEQNGLLALIVTSVAVGSLLTGTLIKLKR